MKGKTQSIITREGSLFFSGIRTPVTCWPKTIHLLPYFMRFAHMLRAYAALRAQLVTEKDGDEEQVSGTGQVGSTGNYSCTDYSWSTCFKDTDGTRINTIKEVDFLPSFQPVVCQSHLLVHFCTRLWICNPLPRNILEKAIELLITSVSCLI